MAAVKYVQIMQDIKKKIEQGILKPGDMMKSEKALGEEYSLSRMSVRKGLTLLTERGYITSIPGKGYFVNQPASCKYIFSFDESDFIEKHVTSVNLYKVDIIEADEQLSSELEVKVGNKVIILKHLFFRDKRPIAYDIKHFPYVKGNSFVESQIGYATYPSKALQNSNAFSLQRKLRISVVISNEEIQEILQLDKPHGLMVLEQKYRDMKSNTLMWGKLHLLDEYGFLEADSAL